MVPASASLSAKNSARHTSVPRRKNIRVVFAHEIASQVSSPARMPSGSPLKSTSVARSQPD